MSVLWVHIAVNKIVLTLKVATLAVVQMDLLKLSLKLELLLVLMKELSLVTWNIDLGLAVMTLEGCTRRKSVVVPLELLGDLDALNVQNLELQPLMNFVLKAMDSLTILTLMSVWPFLTCAKMEDVRILLEASTAGATKDMPSTSMESLVVTLTNVQS